MLLHRVKGGGTAVAPWDEFEAPPSKVPRRLSHRRVSVIEVIVLVMIVGFLAGLLLPAGDWDFTPRYPPPSPIPGTRFSAVAGDYSQGLARGLNWSLSLLHDGRYSFVWSGCTGIYGRESGWAQRIRGYLVLTPVTPIKPPLERVFLPVRWGRRTYLVPPQRLAEFCDAIVQGDEPRNQSASGKFYAKRLIHRVEGTPDLPERWAAYLRSKLVLGTIVDVMKNGRARVNVGSKDGISVESILAVQGRDHFTSHNLRVISVNQGSCEAEEPYPGEYEKPLEVGWKVVAEKQTEKKAANP